MCSRVWFKRQLEMENYCTNEWPYIQFLKLSLRTESFRQRKGAPVCARARTFPWVHTCMSV